MKNDIITLTEFETNRDHIDALKSHEIDRIDRHLGYMAYGQHGLSMKEPSMLAPEHPDFELPSKEMVRDVVGLLKSRGYTLGELSDFMGFIKSPSGGSNRTLSRWMSEDYPAKAINIPAWLMLRSLAGLPIVTMLPEKGKK
ncbi:hypothetical protein L8R85_02210 [Vibrio splendidus]|uniref:Uncharacterized protein n=2 Tax=Vibrio TaxID=662 RepID=A0A4R3P7S3_9VIBR|nr:MULTISPECIES: hypothetical protein [Vibrio]MDH5919830.1 hypothetical protein [Vibrio splendidus]TCN05641.1 hypothetical protein EDB35_116139 [Vibrio crassostreae]TCT46147.1 hypothetical protein EDB39_11419 [Vibrio crassostreae]TCT54246.1 hypothetical protein EDB40_114133 [Vibrio crassostreae]TCT58887.1 hypothetical protein EDB44_11822 [Vibrio crassostreae]